MTKKKKPNPDEKVIPVDELLANVSEFKKRCYLEILRIPAGKISTYGAVAKALKPPSSARAVGGAMRNNPFAPRVPCHRIVASTLDIGGYMGDWGPGLGNVDNKVNKKIRMLEEEGVTFHKTPIGKVRAKRNYLFKH